MNKTITKNYLYNVAYQIIIIILPIITTPYLARILGAEAIGIHSYTLSIVTYFVLFGSLGIVIYGQREIARTKDNKEEMSKTFFALFVLRAISLISAIITFFFMYCIKEQYQNYYRILVLEIIASIFDISWFFQGIEEFRRITKRNIVVKCIGVMMIFAIIKSPNDLWKYFAIYAISNIAGNIALWKNIEKYICFVRIQFKDVIKHLKPTISMFIPQIASSIYTVLDKTMLGNLCVNITEVAYYEQAQKIVKISLTLVTSMMTVMIPRIAKTYSEGQKDKVNEYMEKTFNFIWFLAIPIMFGIIAIAENFIPWFLGKGYEKVIILTQICSPIILLISFSTTTGSQFLMSINKQNIHSIAVICGAIINIILNFILISKLESVGAVIATIIAELTITIIEIVYVIKTETIKMKTMFKYSNIYIISGSIMCLIVYLLGKSMQPNIITSIVQILIGVVIYITSLILFKEKNVLHIIDLAKSKMKGSK